MTHRFTARRTGAALRWMAAAVAVVLSVTFAIARETGGGHDQDHGHGAEAAPAGSHAGHDHDDEAHPPDGHAGHDHGGETHAGAGHGEDAHAGHGQGDGHEDEGVVRIDPATMKEFDIAVQQAGPGALGQTLELPGEIVFNADRIAHVTPAVAGIVRRVEKTVGDRVEAGQVMAVLGSRELAAARSEYLAARARLKLTRDMLSRDERMLADRIGTERRVLESQQSMREAEIALNLAEQNLHALGQGHAEIGALDETEDPAFSEYRLRTPLDGIVIERHLTRGEMVGAESEAAPFVVADLSSVWVNLTVYQRDLASIRPGQSVHITFGHGIPDATGGIAFISPALDERTRTATARVVLENPDGHWRPGLFVAGRVVMGEKSAAVVVPRSAVTTMDGQAVVFIETPQGFEPRPVQTGRATEDRVEIIEGVHPGDRYVARNVLALKAEMNRAALEHAGHAH